MFLIVAAPIPTASQLQLQQQAKGVQTNQQTNGTAGGQQQPGAANSQPGQGAFMVPIPSTAFQKQEGDQPAKKATENGTEYWPTVFGIRLKITDTLLAIFTFFLVIIGWWQARRLRQTIESVEIAERPYLMQETIHSWQLSANTRKEREQRRTQNQPEPSTELGLRQNIINVGRTPALVEAFRGEIETGQLPNRPVFSYSREVRKEIGVAPNHAYPTPSVEPQKAFTWAEIDSFTSAKVSFFYFGYIRYRDVFGNRYTNGFCYKLVGSGEWEAAGGDAYNYYKTDPHQGFFRRIFSSSKTA